MYVIVRVCAQEAGMPYTPRMLVALQIGACLRVVVSRRGAGSRVGSPRLLHVGPEYPVPVQSHVLVSVQMPLFAHAGEHTAR